MTDAVAGLLAGTAAEETLLRRIHANAGVHTRSLVLPLEEYRGLDGFGTANDAWLEHAPRMAVEAVNGALERAGVTADQVDVVVSTTVTGIAVPSLEARIAAEVGFREDVVRVPLFGLGCVAGAAGIARVHDLLAGRPEGVAVLLAVELCSLTVQQGDASRANMVASGLFGDGAAAVVLSGPDAVTPAAAPGPRLSVVASRSRLYPDTHRAMGWDVGDGGLGIVLGAEVPDLVTQHVGADVETFLADHGLTPQDIAFHVAHPGGPKVLQAMEGALGVPREALGLTWDSLSEVGNLSSVSVLHVLGRTLAERPPTPGQYGLLLAMGPGFCAELVLLRCEEAA
ncbi:type III polyketide synthase [Kytococcus sedentarius]|uniref:type III polyketide synthase n=1 Tax=Kytococcus sedentarius TaxID=1276 RepID=UPI0035BBD878